MDKLHLPQWHSPEHVRDILLALPEKKAQPRPIRAHLAVRPL